MVDCDVPPMSAHVVTKLRCQRTGRGGGAQGSIDYNEFVEDMKSNDMQSGDIFGVGAAPTKREQAAKGERGSFQ